MLRSFDPSDRRELFATVKRLKPQNLFINESLTKEKENLFYQARQYKRVNNLRVPLYSFRGNIFFRKSSTEPIEIKTPDDFTLMKDISVTPDTPRTSRTPTTDSTQRPKFSCPPRGRRKKSTPIIPATRSTTRAAV